MSFVLAVFVAVMLSGCGSGETGPETSPATGASASLESTPSTSAEGAAAEADGPTILGIDSELQREMRGLIAQFIEERQFPGDSAENLAKAFDSAMQTIRRPANEFGIQPDADGNLEWPDELEEQVKALRAKFDAKTLFDSHEIDLPEWAKPLLDEYNANTISPTRKELLFRLASGIVMRDMA